MGSKTLEWKFTFISFFFLLGCHFEAYKICVIHFFEAQVEQEKGWKQSPGMDDKGKSMLAVFTTLVTPKSSVKFFPRGITSQSRFLNLK
jgi:hypothetical protein